ncbi:hypothetical protein GCM10027290_34460 [Micromonospora sonneratiae]|uniref:histidine kinase n=1 Tax=Micromonospora sonneratiae TaxID=1184706 RepID=A0ABW3YHR5_9ACTN
MPERLDYAALIAGQTVVIEMINSGDAGLPAINELLQLVQRSLGAAGMAFVEYAPTGGRVIAATGGMQWSLGRPLPTTDPAIARLLTGPRVQELCFDQLPPILADQLIGRGLHRMITARAEIGGVAVGSLHALYPDAEGCGSAEQRMVLAHLAACAAHIYGDQTGLPMHGDGPVVAALTDGLAIVNQDGLVRLWNPAAERVTGWAAAQLLNRPLPFPVQPSGQLLDHRLADGRWIRITATELPGFADHRVVTFRDITDQHLPGPDHDLFVAVTSHELRTPVTVIKGYAETLSNHWDSLSEPQRRQAARVIGQRADELARLVDRLLAATNDAGPAGDAPPVPFDLVEALRSAVGNLPTDLRHRLRLDLPENLPKALGDRASLATMLTELTTNAEKYSEPGSPVEVSADYDKRTVSFQVSDRGIGIRPEHVERAFERFWQGESGDRRQYRGAGLGLYLVRRIVERQNGWVSLRPREGGGTVAEVRLPRG